MAITTLDQWIASALQKVRIYKSASATSVALNPQSVFAQAGNPGAGTLAGTSTTTGVVPTDATTGCPTINAFGGGALGEIGRLEFSNTVACRMALYDVLWKGGAYAFNVATSGNSPTSFSSRVPGGTDFTAIELWYEQVTAGTLVQNVNVNYNDQANVASSTGVVACPAAMIVGRMHQLPLAAGDTGLQGITGVAGSVASAGTFNLLAMRRLGEARIRVAGDVVVQGMLDCGRAQVFEDSALVLVIWPDGTATGLPECIADIRNG